MEDLFNSHSLQWLPIDHEGIMIEEGPEPSGLYFHQIRIPCYGLLALVESEKKAEDRTFSRKIAGPPNQTKPFPPFS